MHVRWPWIWLGLSVVVPAAQAGLPLDRGPVAAAARSATRQPLAAPAPDRPAGDRHPPTQTAGVPDSGPEAHVLGHFGPVVAWPSVPIHWGLTPDGRVMSFGATSDGRQGGYRDFVVWDPALGTGASAFQVLPNTTAVDTFCAGQWLLAGSGETLITGGNQVIDGINGVGRADVLRYSPTDNRLTPVAPMRYRRWYATTLANGRGEVVALGGRIDPAARTQDKATVAQVPEVLDPLTGQWRELTQAASDHAYGINQSTWWYPRAWLAPDDRLFIVAHNGRMFSLDTQGEGHLTAWPRRLPAVSPHLPAAMYLPGRLISVRDNQRVVLININGPAPAVQTAAPISRHRRFASGTLLANGQWFVNGGTSADDNVAEGAHLQAELWDPSTGQWTSLASAALPRLYHSNALLLPDATVLTGGGGLPGPLLNDNVEIYYPPYLYKPDGSGQPAERPVIDTTPLGVTWAQTLKLTASGPLPIARVTLVGSGQATHAFNVGQRFQTLNFTAGGSQLSVKMPRDRHLAPAGYYLLFAIDTAGVPSVAKLLRLND